MARFPSQKAAILRVRPHALHGSPVRSIRKQCGVTCSMNGRAVDNLGLCVTQNRATNNDIQEISNTLLILYSLEILIGP